MMLASGQVCYGCSKAGASPLSCSWSQIRSGSDPPTIRQLTTRATALEMAAQLPALQCTSEVHAMKILRFCTLARSDPPPVVKGSSFSFLCPHRHPRILHSRCSGSCE